MPVETSAYGVTQGTNDVEYDRFAAFFGGVAPSDLDATVEDTESMGRAVIDGNNVLYEI